MCMIHLYHIDLYIFCSAFSCSAAVRWPCPFTRQSHRLHRSDGQCQVAQHVRSSDSGRPACIAGQPHIRPIDPLWGSPVDIFHGRPDSLEHANDRRRRARVRCAVHGRTCVLEDPLRAHCSTCHVVRHPRVVGSTDACLYALNPVTGSAVWSFQTGGPVWSSPVRPRQASYCHHFARASWVSLQAIGANGIIYVGSFDGKLYALKGVRASAAPGTRTLTCHCPQTFSQLLRRISSLPSS